MMIPPSYKPPRAGCIGGSIALLIMLAAVAGFVVMLFWAFSQLG